MDIIRLFADGFPLTIERLQFLQNTYGKAISQLTKMAVVLNGEVLEFQGGTLNSRVAVFETVDEVPYNVDADNDGNLDLKVADVVRVARCAASGGVDAVAFASLTRVGSLQLNQFPVGAIIPFDGDINNLPAGWELYNLANQFIMGAGGTHSLNGTGGTNSVTLQRANIPNFTMTGRTGNGGGHSHGYRDGYFVEAFESPNDVLSGYDSELVGNNFRGSGDTDSDNRYIWYKNRTTNFQSSHDHSISVNTGGSGSAVENRPSFKALNFIRFVGF